MPKQKTHSGAKKRFKVSGSGKIIRERANRRHQFEWKPSKRTRRLHVDVEASPSDSRKARKLLGR